jgi:hypothetical protein
MNGVVKTIDGVKPVCDIKISWDKDTIKFDKEIGRNEHCLYPDSTLWGISINGICNPTFEVFCDEISGVIKFLIDKVDSLERKANEEVFVK